MSEYLHKPCKVVGVGEPLDIEVKGMTNEEAIEILRTVEVCSFKDKSKRYFFKDVTDAFDLAIKALEQSNRYKPIILQEHDSEPRRLKAILDTHQNNVYVLEATTKFAEGLGMTIEEVQNDE